MNRIIKIIFLLLLLPLIGKPVVLDSLEKEKLIEQGIYKLNKLKKENAQKIAEGKNDELNFIIEISPLGNTNYINELTLNSKPNFLDSQVIKDTLNNKLKVAYNKYNKECYLILISAFDVKIDAVIPEDATTKDLFNKGKFFNENSDIETHKGFHNDVVNQITNNNIATNNRNCFVLSVGAYCGAFFNKEVGCYYYWYINKSIKQSNPTVQYYDETYTYLNTFLKNSKNFQHPVSRNNIAEQVVNAFESAAKNASLKAQILTTYTPAGLESILQNFTNSEDYYTLTLTERIHILKVFLTPLTFNTAETYINNTLRTTVKKDVDSLLLGLIDNKNNINGNCLLSKLFAGMQLGNYATCIKELCTLVGRSSLDDRNLPTDVTNYNDLQIAQFTPNETWKRTFEWTDCWDRINPQDPNNPNNVSLNTCEWNNLEKRFTSVTLGANGTIVVKGFYDTGQDFAYAAGSTTAPSPITAFTHTFDPYDLIVFVNKSSISSINEGTNEGVVIVPALFLKYAIDKSFNQGLYDAAMADLSILSIVGIDELYLASKALGKLSKIKSFIKWMRGGEVLNNAGSLASHVDIQASLSTILNLKNTNKLTKSIGSASDLELGAIHKYTEDGGVILTSMRNGNETVIDAVNFNTFQSQLYQSIKSGLTKLRQTNRLVTGTVTRGRTYKLADYNALFNSGSVNIPLKGMVSCTKNESVAIDFLTKSGQNISGSKVKVIMKIKSKNGVDIDDFSDWGVNLVNQRHPGNLIQEEVLLDEGMFKMIGQPVLIKTESGIPWYEINLEELGTPLRTIN